MLSENGKIVFNYLKEHDGENFTAPDIAEATGLNIKSVNGILTMTFQRHKEDGEIIPLIERVPAEIELADGTHKTVKLVALTDAGRAWVPDAPAADAVAE